MSSRPAPPLTRFLDVLSQAGLDVSVEGVMDAFWLALQPGLLRDFGQPAARPVPVEKPAGLNQPRPIPQPVEPKPDVPPPAGADKPKPDTGQPSGQEDRRTDVFSVPASKDTKDTLPASPLRVPAGVALACKLPLTRSLRPLRKWFRNPQIQQLDEEGTVEETARAGRILVPVLQPALERWYDLVLVADAGSSMDVWQETLNEFVAVARTAGVFRDIRRYRLSWLPERLPEAEPEAKPLPPEERAMLTSAEGIAARAIQLAQTNVRRMVLIATQGVGPSWTDGSMAALVRIWSRQCTVAALQMLPEPLWPRVPTGEPTLLLRTLSSGTKARSLDARALWWDEDLADAEGNPVKRVEGAIPILPLDPSWVGKWAGMQMGNGQWVPGIALADLNYPQITPPAPEQRPLDYWYRLVGAFERSVSPEARLLAVYLSQGTFTLPVARLVQTAKLAGLASQTQLAEILLSGLAERTTPADAKVPPEWVEYRFQPDAAQVLSRGLRETDKEEIAQALAAHIEHYWGRPVDFQALVYDATGQAAIPAWAQPFVKLGSLLSNVPSDPEPPDDGRPTVFIVWLTPTLKALGLQVADGLRPLGMRVLVSGRHRVPDKGVILMITESDPNAAYLTDELLRAAQSGLDEVVLWGPGAGPTISSDLHYDRFSAPEELFAAIVNELRSRSQEPAPPVHGSPPIDRGSFTWSQTHAELFQRMTTSTLIVYSNEAFDGTSAVRDVVWMRDLRLRFPAGVQWLRQGEEISPQPDRLLVLEKFSELPGTIPSGCGCVLIDPDLPAAAAAHATSVYEGAPYRQEELRELLRHAIDSKILGQMPLSRHLLSVADHLSRSRIWASIGSQVLRTIEGTSHSEIIEYEISLRTTIFAALDPASRDYVGKLAAVRDGVQVLIGGPLLDLENLAGLVELDLLDEGSPRRATPTARYLASRHSDWGTWNLNALEAFGLSPTSDWYEVATREPYIRQNLIFHLGQAGNLDYIEKVISDFRWWTLRIANEGTPALVTDLRGVTGREVFALIGRLLDSIRDVATRSAEEIASWVVYYHDSIPEALRRSASAFLKSHEPGALGEGEQARIFFQKDIEIAERLASQEPGRADYQRDLSVSYNKMGDLMRDLGEFEHARILFQKSLEITERLTSQEPDRADYQRDLSASCSNMGNLMRAMGNVEQARIFFQQSLEIAQRLAGREPDRADYQRDLSASCSNMGNLMRAMGNVEQARIFFQQSLEIAQRLAGRDPDRADYQRDLSASCSNMGNLMRAMGNVEQARIFFQQSLEINQRLASREPDRADYQRDLSVSYKNMGDLMSGPDAPARFILLAGSRASISDEIRWTAEAIGKEIARKGFGMMCGVEPGSDRASIAGFSEESRLRQRDPARGLRIVTYQDDLKGAELPPGTSVRIVPNQAIGSVGMADDIILLGGADWVQSVYDEAISAGKPVYPVQATGGAAARLFAQQSAALSKSLPSGGKTDNPPWARPIRNQQDAQAVAAALLDHIAGPPQPATGSYPADLLRQWNDYLDPASDNRGFLDWRRVTPQFNAETFVQLLESYETGERLIAFTSFWANPAPEVAAQVGDAAVRGFKSAQALTEWNVLLGVCEVLLLEANAFPGEDFPALLESVLEERRVQVSSRLESARGRQVRERLQKVDRQIEAWIQAVRLPAPSDPARGAAERTLGRLQPAHGRYELESHLKRTQGWAYRLYAYAVLEQNPDGDLKNLLIDCLLQREDRSPSIDLGVRALRAMAKGNPPSAEQIARLMASQGPLAEAAARLIADFPPTPTLTPYATSPQSGPIAITFRDNPTESHGTFVITRGVHKISPAQDYRMGTYPVTNQLFLEFVQQRGYLDDSLWEGQSRQTFLTQDGSSLGPGSWPSSAAFPPNRGNHPVAEISYLEAQAFARWLQRTRPPEGWTWSIPSEDMWELCARSAQGFLYPWGPEFLSGRCNSQEAGLADTSEVGRFSQGNSLNGCSDMAGNVWEFVVGDNSPEKCVLRGGSYKNNQFEIRNCFRLVGVSVTYRAPDFGIRCCQVPTPDGRMVSQSAARPVPAPRKKAKRPVAKKRVASKKK